MEDEVMRPFETQFLVDVSEEGFNPFYKEPVSKISHSNAASGTNSPAATTPIKNEFTDEHTNALISVSIPLMISCIHYLI